MKTLREISDEFITKEDIGKDFIYDWISINYIFSKTDNVMRDIFQKEPEKVKSPMRIFYSKDNNRVDSIEIQFEHSIKARAFDFGLKKSNALNSHAVFEKLLESLNKLYKYHPKDRTTFGQEFEKIKKIFPPDVISRDLLLDITDIPLSIRSRISSDKNYLYDEIASLQKFRNYYIHNSNYDSRMFNIVNYDESDYGLDFLESIHIKSFCIYLCGIYIIRNVNKLST